MERILGILGGMGPLATADFMEKIIRATPASCDQDHVAVIAASLPQIPDRSAAITGEGPSPLAAMVGAVRRLERAGVGAIAIPCNTAHHWHDAISRHTERPLFHIADAALDAIRETGGAARVGLLATTGTLASGMYAARLARAGITTMAPDETAQEYLVMAGIRAVKGGDVAAGARALAAAADGLLDRGAGRIIMACTEVPPALAAANRTGGVYVDATDALARACVKWHREPRTAAVPRAA